MSVFYQVGHDKLRSYWITYAQKRSAILSESSENCENIGPTFDNVDENIENSNSVVPPAGICPPPLKHTLFIPLWGGVDI